MAHDQVAVVAQAAIKFLEQPVPRQGVEIYDDVAAEYDVEPSPHRVDIVEEVEAPEPHEAPHRVLDLEQPLVLAGPPLEIPPQELVVDHLHLGVRVHALFSPAQNLRVDVSCEDLHVRHGPCP